LWVLASLAIGGLAATALVHLVGGGLEVASYDAAADALRAGGTGGTQERLVAVALMQVAVGVLTIGCYLFTVVSFVCWLFRARRNGEALGVAGFRWSPGWTIGSWFIPFVNLVLPFRVVAEIGRASDPGLPDNHLAYPAYRRQVLLGFWWAAWLVFLVVDRVKSVRTRQLLRDDPSLEEIVAGRSAELAWTGLGAACIVVAAVLAALVVLQITRNQHRRIALGSGAPGAPSAVAPSPLQDWGS
jgi:hypothetical protein